MQASPEQRARERHRRDVLADGQRDVVLERQAAALTGSHNVYEPGIRRTIWKLMVGSHAGRIPS